MNLFVIDTDTLTLYGEGHAVVTARIDARPTHELAIAVITVDEQLSGWYTSVRKARKPDEITHAYGRLAQAVVFLAQWQILPYSLAAQSRFAQLRSQRLNVRPMDLRIAAIALEHKATVVTRNLRDFRRVPGLNVEDWSV